MGINPRSVVGAISVIVKTSPMVLCELYQLYLLRSALLVFWTDDVNLIMLVSYRPLVHVNDVISVGNQESENISVQLCSSCCLQTMFCVAHIGFVVFQ